MGDLEDGSCYCAVDDVTLVKRGCRLTVGVVPITAVCFVLLSTTLARWYGFKVGRLQVDSDKFDYISTLVDVTPNNRRFQSEINIAKDKEQENILNFKSWSSYHADLDKTALGQTLPHFDNIGNLSSIPDNRSHSAESTQVVTPWEVQGDNEGKIDYDKLVDTWGCSKITPELIARIENVTGCKAHPLLRRGCFYAHRDLEQLLNTYEKNPRSFYLYTGRGPSSEALHLGHLIPFHFTKWLQDAFNVPLVIQLTDDEKYLWKDLTLEECERLAYENAKDIIAVGFNPNKTFIFTDCRYMGSNFYRNCLRIGKAITLNNARQIFGYSANHSIGQVGFPPIQAAPCFSDSFPHLFGEGKKGFRCLIPCAIDQDPYFRMTRQIASKLGGHKPALIEAKFFPSLKGDSGKMSASDVTSAIYVTDTPKMIKKKINSHAFSGGMPTVEEQREKGANLDIDVPWKWLNFFLHDDAELARIGAEYGNGRMLTGEIKAILIEVLTKMVKEHQEAKAKLTNADVAAFFSTVPRSRENLFGPGAKT